MEELTKRQHECEIDLRGKALTVASNIEVIIMDTVYFSNTEQYRHPDKSKSLVIDKVTFGGKITKLKDVLKDCHPDLLDANEQLFIYLGVFLDLRNKLAHDAIYWLDDGLNKMVLLEPAIAENGMPYYSPIEYARLDLLNEIAAHLNKITPLLTALKDEIYRRMEMNNPVVYAALTSGLNMFS